MIGCVYGNRLYSSCVLAMLAGIVLRVKSETMVVNLSTDNVVRTTSDRFLSITLGSTIVRNGWRTLKDSRKLLSLARGLSPAYFRIGGTVQDYLYWDKDGEDDNCYNAAQLERLYQFAQNARLDLIFGLSPLTRKPDGTWDPTNAEELFQFMSEKGYSMSWELGNEPDLWPVHNITDIPPQKLARDFQRLKDVLKRRGKENTKIYGPDVATLSDDQDFLKTFLKEIGGGILDAVTYHQYYRNSDGAKLEDFKNVSILDRFLNYSQKAVKLVHSTLDKNTPIWLGETSSTYNSGAKGLSDSYLAGFMWLDKLGIAALVNHDVVCRQSIYGGHYSLIDVQTMDPLPDYWTSVLHKRLVGSKVLMVENSLKPGRNARVYAHCTRITKYYDYEAGAVTLIVLNLHQDETLVIELQKDLKKFDVDQFLLQPGTKNITSKSAKLNGKLLKLLEDYRLPDLNAVKVNQPFSVPPLTYGFFVIPNANAKGCLTNIFI
ncbi:heparanase-like [Dendronephthya gigantea]|uniref:heparanase-like n=1 Tax=Dendronephthya gigantea TaxID=151771 RepID=UPI00106AA8D3|nr:heparanase-like [Dendronephthya gigantea]